jgi:twitching motility protein PilT
MDLAALLKLTIDRGASDLHLVVGYYPTIRVNGELMQLRTLPRLTKEVNEKMLLSLVDEEQKENLLINKELDFGYDFNSTRFRINLYFTNGAMSGSFRHISSIIRTIDELQLPAIFHQFTHLRQGLILLTGPTGEGKSTTLAAIINEINLQYERHILTIEDPIEYVYPEAKSIISQREIGHDSHSWAIALKAALREDPDVVLVGEMRDYETIQAALTIAETGHLVFSTVHTNSSPQTIDRIIDVFPPAQQNQIRIQLSSVLKAVISQRLVPNIDITSRTAACEILLNNSAVANIIREGKTHLIDNVIQTAGNDGMYLMEKSLFELYTKGKISRDTFLSYSIRPEEAKKLLDR